MKRFHVHLGVTDLDRSIAFYSQLFGAAPSVAKPRCRKTPAAVRAVKAAIVTGAATAAAAVVATDRLAELK